MSLDYDIKRAVEVELRSDPDIEASDIAVEVNAGRVVLRGFVCSYAQGAAAARDARWVAGVAGVDNDIEVRLPLEDRRPDGDIVEDAVLALHAQLPYSCENIEVTVVRGNMTLGGAVEWNYAREHAENAVKRLRGIQGVINSIAVRPKLTAQEAQGRAVQTRTDPTRGEDNGERLLPVWVGG